MSRPPQVADQTGRPIPLDRPLASGGEGAVYTLPGDPSLVAKVYHAARRTAERSAKLRALLALKSPGLLKVAAWPMGLLFDPRSKDVMGFVMPRMLDCRPIQQLYNPAQRLQSFPRAGWRFQVRAAINLAAAFDEVHRAGCLVGDVNESNALVSTQALVRLIDCDSFQVRAAGRHFLCEVGKPHYTPPELQGRSFRGLTRTENHDRFGLAVLIYQLLFVGRHPYMGVYQGRGDPSFEQLIAEYRFAQGPAAASWGMAPPPHVPTFADIPADLGVLLRRAFERGGEASGRPTAADWLGALGRLEQSLGECAADPGHTYWRGAGGCVWCRLEGRGAPPYYFGVAGVAAGFAIDETRLRAIARRLEELEPPAFPYDRDRFVPPRPPSPVPLPDDLDEHRAMSLVLWVAVAFCGLLTLLGLYRGFFAAIGLVGAAVFGGWLAVLRHNSPWHREFVRRRRAFTYARGDLHELEEEWHRIVQRYRTEFGRLRRAAERAAAECRGLTSGYQDELRRLAGNAEAQARDRHLRLHAIALADIPRIGAGRKMTLAVHGISTAADVTRYRVAAVPGFGDALTAALLEWRGEVERRFRFDPTTAVSVGEQRAVAVRFRTRQQQLLGDIDQKITALGSFGPGCKAELEALTGKLGEAVAAFEQADVNLALLRRGA